VLPHITITLSIIVLMVIDNSISSGLATPKIPNIHVTTKTTITSSNTEFVIILFISYVNMGFFIFDPHFLHVLSVTFEPHIKQRYFNFIFDFPLPNSGL
jgi:hypothetical protein